MFAIVTLSSMGMIDCPCLVILASHIQHGGCGRGSVLIVVFSTFRVDEDEDEDMI